MKKNRGSLIFHIAAWVCVALFAVSVLIYGLKTDFGMTAFSKTMDDGVYGTSYTYEEEMKKLHTLQVEWVNGPVTVAFYNGSTVQLNESAKAELEEDEKLYLEISGGELSVRWNSELLQFDTRQNPKSLEILLPKVFFETMEEVKITTVSGTVEVEDLTAEEIRFESKTGEIHLKNIAAERFTAKTKSGNLLCQNITGTEKVQVSSNSGDITLAGLTAGVAELDTTSGDTVLSGTVTDLECVSVSGDVQMDFSVWPEKTEVRTVNGDTEILAPVTLEGFICRFTSVSGEFDSDFALKRSDDLYTCGEEQYSLRFDTTSGDVALHQKLG